MKEMLKRFFTHPSVWTYIAIAIALFIYLYRAQVFGLYYWVLFLPIVIAPFFEWFAHKYLLHMRIGTVVKLNKNDHPELKLHDKITLVTSEGEKEFEVIEANNETINVAHGFAKKAPKWLLNFMENLHYGHHKDPNYVPLIFAPIISVFILFGAMFGIFFLISWNLNMSTMFLFGVVIYYLHYEWMHLGHHTPEYHPITPWGKKLKQAHLFHHFRNENYWWGITNIWGDIILGTNKHFKDVEMSKTKNDINP